MNNSWISFTRSAHKSAYCELYNVVYTILTNLLIFSNLMWKKTWYVKKAHHKLTQGKSIVTRVVLCLSAAFHEHRDVLLHMQFKKEKEKKNICNNISNNMEGYMYATTISPLNSFMIKVTFASIYCPHQGLRKSRSEKQVLHTVDFFFFSAVVLFSSFVCLDLCSFFQQGKSVLQIETSFWSVLPNSISSMLSHQVFQGKGVATTKGCPPVLPKNNSGTEEINWSTTL